MRLLTIFTPSYNRAHTLGRLYESLAAQSDMRFEWVVVDDGSTDGTAELLKGFKKTAPFSVTVITKENGGKPAAINDGLRAARGEFFFMLDSDDYLSEDGVEKLFRWCEEIEGDGSFVGVGAAKAYIGGTYIKGVPPKVGEGGYVDATNLERRLYDLDADMCEAYKTEIFRRFPFVTWEGERFVPEQIVLNEMALAGYRLRWHKDIIYYCEYLEGGLTRDSRLLVKQNPMGYAMMYGHMTRYGLGFGKSFKCAMNMVALSVCGGHPFYFLKSDRRGLAALAFLPGLLLSIRRRRQFKRI
ncbi:MAG: glycosyltransferase family 2 protein [Clostridia bacterium]|nr:glycosyltransferase family 2 protein [Clostridia bacterium]